MAAGSSFDGNGHAFITTGEHFTDEERQKAQDLNTTYGKVVRGSILMAPFQRTIRLSARRAHLTASGPMATEMFRARPCVGTSCSSSNMAPLSGDEINIPEAGLNYGWPVVSYGVRYDGGEIGTGNAQAEEWQNRPITGIR